MKLGQKTAEGKPERMILSVFQITQPIWALYAFVIKKQMLKQLETE